MGLFHKYVAILAEETGHSKDEIKIEMKKHYGSRNDDGTLKSMSAYTTIEMSKIIDGIYTFGTQDLGLRLPLPDDLRTHNLK